MKVLVIPDIHLKTWIFDRAEEIIDAILEGKDVLAKSKKEARETYE